MLFSAYNIILERGSLSSLLFNTSSGVICELENEVLSLYENSPDISSDNPYYDELVDLEILSPAPYRGLPDSKDKHRLTIILSLSEACNLSCFYCFQREVEKSLLQTFSFFPRLLSLIEEYADKEPDLKELRVVWFGGEPLLWKKEIGEYSHQLIDLCERLGIKFFASLITNGTLLDRDFICALDSLRIRTVQITVDGDKDTFTTYKKGTGSLWHQLNTALPELVKVATVTLRINLDRQNYDALEHYLKELADSGILDNVNIHIARIETSDDSHSLSQKEFYAKKLQLIRYLLTHLHYSRTESLFKDLQAVDTSCRLMSSGSLVIDSKGRCHKCDEKVGTQSSVSITDTPGTIIQEINRNYLESHPDCIQCPIYPICRGECPEHWSKEDCKYKIDYLSSLALMKAKNQCEQDLGDE